MGGSGGRGAGWAGWASGADNRGNGLGRSNRHSGERINLTAALE